VGKLEGFLVQYGLPLAEAVPLLAAVLSLPLPADYAPLAESSEQQKQRTLQTFLTILGRIAAQQPVLFVMEDLHWADPTTLELLSLFVDQGPTVRILALWTFRPDFTPPWMGRTHLTQVTLPRLPRHEATEMTGRVAHGKALPAEVVEQVVAKTDGVPLFVEELTKMVLESGLLQERDDRYELTGPLPPLAIPTTLHDSLMARLDRLAAVKGLAQLGATLGREFSYALLQAVSPWDEGTLRWGLHQLVEAELLYQQGLPPQATYLFKHVLIQEAAYQSLLRSMRQQYHQRIAQVLEARFPDLCETQPELLAHHYTEAGLMAQAIPYWQQAGQRALQRSANVEAIEHLTRGLDILKSLPESPEHAQRELDVQVALGPALMAVKGQGAPDVAHAYARARELCQQVGDTPQLFAVLRGLVPYYLTRGQVQEAHQLAEQLLRLAEAQADPAPRLLAHFMLGQVVFYRGEPAMSQTHHAQALALYTSQEVQAPAVRYGLDLGVGSHSWLAWALWQLGAPTQALRHSQAARTLAQEGSHSVSLVFALLWAAFVHLCRREVSAVHELAMAAITLATEQGFMQRLAHATVLHGWALARQGQGEVGRAAIRQGLTASRATGSMLLQPYGLGLLAETYEAGGHPDEGLAVLAEAQAVMAVTGVQWYAAELSRLQGALLLRQAVPDVPQAEACFQQALAVARRQQAKSWELRAATSLARLWQQQGKHQEAHDLLGPVYHWFTEGFDTADLQEAKALLAELAR
jgi:predicted ATPase